ncbi:MAG: riboflavin synthase [Deltaproteobacteria bacterium]|nr:riboflavin synthase [Deltaproteobacteria bacterium]
MFTGLIQDVGNIRIIDRRGGGISLTISTRLDLSSVKIGDSIAVDGVCLTVVKLAGRTFTMEVSPETLQRTTLSSAKEGQAVNLEAALKMSDPLGGHLVAGHVDGTGEITGITLEGNSLRYQFRVPLDIGRYLIEKGSLAVDGISLTVAECLDQEFSVRLIPHTAERTTLGKKKVGDRVNLENDMIAKYVEKFVRQRDDQARGSSRIDAEFLSKHGFIP